MVIITAVMQIIPILKVLIISLNDDVGVKLEEG